MTTGEKLRAARGNRTTEEVAKAVGIQRTSITNYETGYRVPRDEIKKKLAAYYGKSVQELFFD